MPLLDDLIGKFSKSNPVISLNCAITKAHTDMSRRARGHSPKIQADSIKWLEDWFKKSSPFACTSLADFDKWHDETCVNYCKHMNAKGFSFVMTYGRAQKVLNMTFKYLYCTSAYKADVEKIIPFLHMTLDGYTLRWYKEVVVKWCNVTSALGATKLKVGDVSDWSKMNESGKHRYIDIQNRIRAYLKTNTNYQYSISTDIINTDIIDTDIIDEEEQPGKSTKTISVAIPFDPMGKHPFFAEFVVWEGEKVRAKIENLLKGLNGICKSWTNDKWAINTDVKKELKSKLTTILAHI